MLYFGSSPEVLRMFLLFMLSTPLWEGIPPLVLKIQTQCFRHIRQVFHYCSKPKLGEKGEGTVDPFTPSRHSAAPSWAADLR